MVTAVRDRRLEMKGFYERRDLGERLGQGVFYSREEIERRNPQKVTGLLAYTSGVRVIRDNQASPPGIDELVLPSEVAAVEVYRGASEVPAQFGGSTGRCGAIVIWTHAGG